MQSNFFSSVKQAVIDATSNPSRTLLVLASAVLVNAQNITTSLTTTSETHSTSTEMPTTTMLNNATSEVIAPSPQGQDLIPMDQHGYWIVGMAAGFGLLCIAQTVNCVLNYQMRQQLRSMPMGERAPLLVPGGSSAE